MYARCLTEMLTNKEEGQPEDFEHIDIDSDLKCILYECYHAKDNTDTKEQERYEVEIARYLQKETEKEGNGQGDAERHEFKQQVAQDKV